MASHVIQVAMATTAITFMQVFGGSRTLDGIARHPGGDGNHCHHLYAGIWWQPNVGWHRTSSRWRWQPLPSPLCRYLVAAERWMASHVIQVAMATTAITFMQVFGGRRTLDGIARHPSGDGNHCHHLYAGIWWQANVGWHRTS